MGTDHPPSPIWGIPIQKVLFLQRWKCSDILLSSPFLSVFHLITFQVSNAMYILLVTLSQFLHKGICNAFLHWAAISNQAQSSQLNEQSTAATSIRSTWTPTLQTHHFSITLLAPVNSTENEDGSNFWISHPFVALNIQICVSICSGLKERTEISWAITKARRLQRVSDCMRRRRTLMFYPLYGTRLSFNKCWKSQECVSAYKH